MKKHCLSLLMVAALAVLIAQPGPGAVNPAYPASETRIDVLTLISQVSADSVLGYIQTLQDFQTRYAPAPNHWAVAAWIKDQYARFGYTDAYLFDFLWGGTRQFNPFATLPGSVFPDIYVLVGGHHDSISSGDPLIWAPGADDNASGAAATIEMARVMRAVNFQPRCSIIFTTFAGEEVGQIGSEAYVQHALADSLDIRLVINLDMIANNDPGGALLKILRYDGSLGHGQNAAAITSQYTGLEPVWGWHNYNGADSHAFWRSGFDVFTISEYDYSPWWHTDQDITANIDADYCAEVIRAALAITAIYSTMPLVPENLCVLDTGSGNSLLAVWDTSPDPLEDHYNVYYGASEDSLAFWQSTPETQCLITGLAEGDSCWVGVSTVDLGGNASYRIHGLGVPLATPRVPSGLADFPQSGAIRLAWTPNTELDLAGYALYRSLDPHDAGTCIATIAAPQCSYTDQNLPGTLDYYCYRIRAIDSQGNQSPLSETVQSRPVSLDMGILVIDETRNFGGGNPFQPTDAMVDGFYDQLLAGFNIAGHWDLEADPDTLRLADIGIYSSLLWHGNDSADVSYPAGVRDVLRQYVALGGNILFSVYQPGTAFEYSAGYPATFAPGDFISEVLGIGSSDYNLAARFKYALPCLAPWPQLEVDSLKTLAAFNGHIFRVESIIPGGSGTSVYCYGSDYPDDSPQGCLNGQSVGVLNQYGLGKALTLSFPIYHMLEASARIMAQYVFGTLFNETTPMEDPAAQGSKNLALLPNHPNPFNPETTLSFFLPAGGWVSLAIYNSRGQMVRRLLQEEQPAGEHSLIWNGLDESGHSVASGLYLCRITCNGKQETRKMILLK